MLVAIQPGIPRGMRKQLDEPIKKSSVANVEMDGAALDNNRRCCALPDAVAGCLFAAAARFTAIRAQF
jgi:hypothetical protein